METFICKNCNWQGSELKLNHEVVETCSGEDKIKICPKCGSYEVIKKSLVNSNQSKIDRGLKTS